MRWVWTKTGPLRSRGAMEKIGGVLRPGTYHRAISANVPHVIYEIRK